MTASKNNNPSQPLSPPSTGGTTAYARGGASSNANIINRGVAGTTSSRQRSWSQENTIQEEELLAMEGDEHQPDENVVDEEEQAFLDAHLMSSSFHGSNHSAFEDDDEADVEHVNLQFQHPPPQQPHFEAYAATTTSAAQVVRTGPLYLALALFFTIPMLIMSVVSTSNVPKPISLDGDPRLSAIDTSSSSLQQQRQLPKQQRLDASSSSFQQQQEEEHYRGRPFSWFMRGAFDQVTTIHETPTARCSLGTSKSSKSNANQQQQKEQLVFESLDVIVVAIVDETNHWMVWEQPPPGDDDSAVSVRLVSGTVQNIHEAPWAAAHRLVQQHGVSIQNQALPSSGHVVISLDAYGLPVGQVPPHGQHHWEFLGRTPSAADNGPLVFSYLFHPAGIVNVTTSSTSATPNLPKQQQHLLPRRYNRTALTRAWRLGLFVDLTHAHTASLALHHTELQSEESVL